jgi:uncharacterized repeat protein (TIGR01451 family)
MAHPPAIFPGAADKQGPGKLRLTAAVPGPVPSCPAPPAGEVGVAYRDTLTMPGGTGPFAWSVWAGALPAGVTLDASSGVLAGMPGVAAVGTAGFTVLVTDANGRSATEATSLAIAAGPALSYPPPPAGEVGAAYSDTLTASGGTGPFAWSVSAGALPAGVTLNASNGVLAGTPAAAAVGTATFTVKVTDAGNQTATEATSLAIAAGPVLSYRPLPGGEVGAVYSDTLTASGGTGPYAWSVRAGAPPAGVTLNASSGVLAGTPAAAAVGTARFTVLVTDANGRSATEATSLAIAAGPALRYPAPPAGEVGVAYGDALTVGGGTGPFAWSVSAGTLPPGVTLNASTGVLAGTPALAAVGTASFTVTVTDANGQTATEATSITVLAGPLLSFPAPPAGAVGVAYGDALTVGGGTGPFAWSVSAGALPAGMTLNASMGVLSGTPTAMGSSAFTVQVSDADGQTATEAVTLAVGAGPLVIVARAGTSSAVPGGTVNFTVTVSNTGTTPFTAVTFTDALAGVLDGAVYNGDAAATAGAVSFASPDLTWTGNLAAGAAAVITFSVTVSDPGTGNGALSASDPTLTSTVTSATVGSNCTPGSAGTRCTAKIPVVPISMGLSAPSGVFTLAGPPGGSAQQPAAVTMTVSTNNPTGYSVTVQPSAPTLAGPAAAIPVGDLYVRGTGQTTYHPLSGTTPTLIHRQTGPTCPDGDPISTDYQINIPDIAPGTYTTTLTYITTVNP